jgi:hypothetical protein
MPLMKNVRLSGEGDRRVVIWVGRRGLLSDNLPLLSDGLP